MCAHVSFFRYKKYYSKKKKNNSHTCSRVWSDSSGSFESFSNTENKKESEKISFEGISVYEKDLNEKFFFSMVVMMLMKLNSICYQNKFRLTGLKSTFFSLNLIFHLFTTFFYNFLMKI